MASATLNRPTVKAAKAVTNLVAGLVRSVTWRLDDMPNIAEIEIPLRRFHEFRRYNAGKPVYIKVRKNFNTKLVFQGWITGRAFDFNSEDETVSVVCQGPRWKLSSDFVKGRYMLNKDSTYRVLTGLKCVFNETLDASTISPQNGDAQKIAQNGVRPFSLNPEDEDMSAAFDINEMLWYTYKVGCNWKLPINIVGNPITLTQFGIGNLGNLEVYDVNIDGLSILAGMTAIFKAGGMRWWCRPVSTTRSEVRAFLSGSAADSPRKYLSLEDIASGVLPTTSVVPTDINLGSNNIEAGRMNEDFSDVATAVYAYGARKIYQETFVLVPGWDAATWDALKIFDIDFIRMVLNENTSGDLWETYKDVGRKWILDEDGAVSGTAYDFSTLFGSNEYAQQARPFLGQLADGTYFTQAEAFNPFSEQWEKIDMNVQILEDQAGIYFEGGELVPPVFCEQAASAISGGEGGTITPDPRLATQVRITACVYEDQALEKNSEEYDAQLRKKWLVGIIPDSDGNNSDVERRMPILVEDEYQTDNQNAQKEAEVEDKLQDLVDRKLEENQDPRVSASFSIPWICTNYEPGDLIIGIRGRNLYFTAQIVEVRFEFKESQRTELVLEDMRMAEY